jgi:lipid-A-disaccharide synthase
LLIKPFVRAPFFSMVNILAGRRVVSELIQRDFTPARVAEETLRLLHSPDAVQVMRSGLAEVRLRLGTPGAVERAADAIAALLAPVAARRTEQSGL